MNTPETKPDLLSPDRTKPRILEVSLPPGSELSVATPGGETFQFHLTSREPVRLIVELAVSTDQEHHAQEEPLQAMKEPTLGEYFDRQLPGWRRWAGVPLNPDKAEQPPATFWEQPFGPGTRLVACDSTSERVMTQHPQSTGEDSDNQSKAVRLGNRIGWPET